MVDNIGIPLDVTLVFVILSILLLLVIIFFLFEETNFSRCIAAIILCTLEIILCYTTAYSLFVTSLYGFDYTGTLISNEITVLAPIGVIFVTIGYMCIIFSFYALYLCYTKPWEAVARSYGIRNTPWYEKSPYDY